ncbi:hypothetical protein MHK_003803 [Candidatus Magnetomorum sp. HK-1]|nr:hypothetical protein MHK_003803 [Candidatus Magnetomorum sp. HK-1]
MRYNPKIHNRNSIRLKNYDYSQTGLYFITICTQNHEHLFGEIQNHRMFLNDAALMLDIQWNELLKRFKNIKLHEYVIMPNHFHGIISILDKCMSEHKVRPYGTLDGTIGRIIQAFKSITTHQYTWGVKQHNWQRFDKKLWQRNYWEHIIRNENEFDSISQYIIDNPKKWKNDKLNHGIGNVVMETQTQYGVEEWMV